MTLTNSANRRVAGHLSDEVKVQSEEGGTGTKPGGSRGGFAARMPGTDNNHIEDFIKRHSFCFHVWLLGYSYFPMQKVEKI